MNTQGHSFEIDLQAELVTGNHTDGRTVYIKNGSVAYRDMGRVKGHEGMHILQCEDGTLLRIGGYWLTARQGQWIDSLEGGEA